MDRYNVAQKINSGAFGAVFEARDKRTGRKVAIKKVTKKFYEFNQRQRNREVKALNELKHPNLITLLDFVEKGNSLFFIFEYMDFNLYEIICNRGGEHFPKKLLQTALSQIILGLEFMHSSGFFHRDLKPENILVTQNCVKIADFGQVHELKTKGKKLTPYVSTRWYRAPEVLLGYRFYGPAIDLWAVGAIAAELMTLRPLFPGATSSDQLNKICLSLGSPGQFSHGGPWPLGSQLANLAGMNFPQQVSGSLMKTLITYPHLDPSCSRFVKALLQFDPTRRITAKHSASSRILFW
ncbi:hypothetical protein DSO57_1012015 [Entomophthora muscae]|uniref:Uncharacterized protein n=1 Tax=Entomophthora muscae TaxID=34485 RepID=A0ACC2UF35_9FUNG|nr:hypothetical protein DSO57_1012015 [Entomophthora muscae]